MDTKHMTGRTTRMIEAAVDAVMKGEQVAIVGANHDSLNWMRAEFSARRNARNVSVVKGNRMDAFRVNRARAPLGDDVNVIVHPDVLAAHIKAAARVLDIMDKGSPLFKQLEERPS